MAREYEQSLISFKEYDDPVKGVIAQVLMDRPDGKTAIVAHICEEYDADQETNYYTAYDEDGNQLGSGSYSLEVLKKNIRGKEDFFNQQEFLKEEKLKKAEEMRRAAELRLARSEKKNSQSRTR